MITYGSHKYENNDYNIECINYIIFHKFVPSTDICDILSVNLIVFTSNMDKLPAMKQIPNMILYCIIM